MYHDLVLNVLTSRRQYSTQMGSACFLYTPVSTSHLPLLVRKSLYFTLPAMRKSTAQLLFVLCNSVYRVVRSTGDSVR